MFPLDDVDTSAQYDVDEESDATFCIVGEGVGASDCLDVVEGVALSVGEVVSLRTTSTNPALINVEKPGATVTHEDLPDCSSASLSNLSPTLGMVNS